MNKLLYALMFITGGGIGFLVANTLLKTKYENIAQKEIDSVKEVYSKRARSKNTEQKTVNQKEQEPKTVNGKKKLESVVTALGYASSPIITEDTKSTIYVISPDSFGETDYDTETLSLYDDGVLADAISGEVIDDVQHVIGNDALNSFGEYDDDSVYVRNDDLRTDYEIVKDARRYDDLYSNNNLTRTD